MSLLKRNARLLSATAAAIVGLIFSPRTAPAQTVTTKTYAGATFNDLSSDGHYAAGQTTNAIVKDLTTNIDTNITSSGGTLASAQAVTNNGQVIAFNAGVYYSAATPTTAAEFSPGTNRQFNGFVVNNNGNAGGANYNAAGNVYALDSLKIGSGGVSYSPYIGSSPDTVVAYADDGKMYGTQVRAAGNTAYSYNPTSNTFNTIALNIPNFALQSVLSVSSDGTMALLAVQNTLNSATSLLTYSYSNNSITKALAAPVGYTFSSSVTGIVDMYGNTGFTVQKAGTSELTAVFYSAKTDQTIDITSTLHNGTRYTGFVDLSNPNANGVSTAILRDSSGNQGTIASITVNAAEPSVILLAGPSIFIMGLCRVAHRRTKVREAKVSNGRNLDAPRP